MFPAYHITPGIVSLWLFLLVPLLACVQAYEELSDKTLTELLRPNNDFDIHNGALLSPILRTRVPGTPGSTAPKHHYQRGKDVPFRNFIATRDPPWASVGDVGRLTLVAHYDSKIEPKGFIGGIDSAAPCAIIMHAMRSIDAALEKKWSVLKAQGLNDYLEEERGLQVIFLDGEEAFKDWTETDSLYGARALATHWGDQVYPAMSEFKSPLSSISLFVLLDLLGSKAPTIHSYYETTHWAYQRLGALEKQFRLLKQFKSASADPWFVDTENDGHKIAPMGGIQDDHIPFLAKGVEILHLIDFAPFKGFPPVWHTIDDDGEHLDLDTVEDWSMLVTAFAAEWMELEGYFDHPSSLNPRSDDESAELEALRMSRKTEL
ncbi:Peptidase M28 [Penicillium cf. griseofulvum]|nr:Peptidase M28 [Penicillium cf. griseofulvum]